MNKISSKTSKLDSKLKKNPSLPPSELIEDIKSILKANPLVLILSQLIEVLSLYKVSFGLLFKALSIYSDKDQLKISTQEDVKGLLDPIYHFFLKSAKDETSLVDFLKILTKFRFTAFSSFEKTMFPYMEFLLKALNIKEPFTNKDFALIKLILNAFLNIVSKLSELQEPKTSLLAKDFYSKVDSLFFRIPFDLRLAQEAFLKFLVALFRALGFFLEKSLCKDPQTLESLFLNLYKYMFLGTGFQKAFFGELKEYNANIFEKDCFVSSASEFSDLEGVLTGGNRLEEVYGKVRNYACLSMQIIVKNNPKIAISNWNRLFRSSPYPKESLLYLSTTLYNYKPNDVILAKEKRRFELSFNEPSLFFLQIIEKTAKVRINLLNLSLILIDALPIKQWLAGFIFKAEKTKKDSFQTVSSQIFNSIRNLNWTLLFALLLEQDPQVLCHFLKVFSNFLSSPGFEKLPEEYLMIVLTHYLSPILELKELKEKGLKEVIIKANTLACISAIISLPKLEGSFIASLIPEVLSLLNILALKPLQDTDEALLIMEGLNFLSKLQKHYSVLFAPFLERLIPLYGLFPSVSHKDLLLREILAFYKLLEEVTKAHNPLFSKLSEEELDDEVNEVKGAMNLTEATIEPFTKEFLGFLLEKIERGLEAEGVELNIASLNIISAMKPEIWEEESLLDYLSRFMKLLENLLEKNIAIKTAVFRTIGLFSEVTIFRKLFGDRIVSLLIEGGKVLKNINAKIKNSCALANWLSKNELLLNISLPKRLISDYLSILCQDSKEKVVCNGLRGLGFFLKTLPKEQTPELKSLYYKVLKMNSPKILWNVCASLRNCLAVLEGDSFIFDQEIYLQLLNILQHSTNYKSQIHAIKTLLCVIDPYLLKKTFPMTLQACFQASKQLEIEHYDLLEYKSLALLKSLLLELMFNRFLLKGTEEYLAEVLSRESAQIFGFINQYVHLIKENYQKFRGFDDKQDIKKPKEEFKGEMDDLPVKGEETVSLFRLELKGLEKREFKELEEKLGLLKAVCHKLCEIIDSKEKIAISFILYDTMKEYSDLELEGTEEMDLKIIKKGPIS